MRIEIGTATNVGLVRDHNEDALLALGPAINGGESVGVLIAYGETGDISQLLKLGATSSSVLIAVADGMGGHQAGEVASTLAVKALATHFSRALSDGQVKDAKDWLRSGVIMANRNVWEASGMDAANQGMGTTLVCAYVEPDGSAVVANVGDSRGYLVVGGVASQVTDDHSWVLDQVRAGLMTEHDAERSSYRHVLSRSLGVRPDVDVDIHSQVKLAPGDVLVLCSDGVSNYLELRDLPPLFESTASADDAAEMLVQIALSRGGHDNATVVVARALG